MSRRTSARPRVVYLDHVAQLSGGELALLRTLPSLLDDVDVLVALAEDGPLVARMRAVGLDVVVLPLGDRVRDRRRAAATGATLSPKVLAQFLAYVWEVARFLRRVDADIVHTNSLKAAVYGGVAGRLARVPVVWHVRDRIARDYLPGSAVLLVRLAARVLPTAVVANSRSTLATLPTRRYSAVVPSPVVVPEHPTGEHRHPLTLGVVGRLAEWKGQHVFLEAFALAFAGKEVRARLVGSAMFGEEAYERRLHGLTFELGIADQVEFRGFRDDVWSELQEIDVVVHCSVVPEPFGQVVVEAMAAGRAVIAANEGGPAETVTDGVDGLLVAPRDPAELARAMRRLAADERLRHRLGSSGRTTAERYGPRHVARALVDLYNQLLLS